MSGDLCRVHCYLPRLVASFEAGKVDRREFLRTATLLGLSATAAYALAGCAQSTESSEAVPPAASSAPPGGTVRIAMPVPRLDSPHTYSWITDSNVARQVCDYLTRTGADNITRPSLLESWRASDDLRTWTLVLRKGVTWSNGDELVAEHVAWNVRRWLNSNIGSSMIGLMKSYLMDYGGNRLWSDRAIEVLDDNTIRLNCLRGELAVPEHLFHFPALILHPSQDGVFKIGVIGTGAFSLEEYQPGHHAIVRRRDGYWGRPARLDAVEFIDFGKTPEPAIAALEAREVEGLFEAPIEALERLQAMRHVALYSVNTGATSVARMQVTQGPWGDARVRKAMRLALDTERLLAIAHRGLGEPAEHHHVSPVHPEYAKLPFMGQDIGEAKRLLAEAGHPDGFSTQFVCKSNPDWEPVAAQTMAEMWSQIGVQVDITVVAESDFWDSWQTYPFSLTSWAHRPLGVMALALAYQSGVPWNESHWSNARFDALLANAQSILDPEQRRGVMGEIESLMQEEGPICQTLWRAVFTAMDQRVQGFAMHPSNYFFCEEWSLEEATS